MSRRPRSDRIEKWAPRHDRRRGPRKRKTPRGSRLHGFLEGGVKLVIKVHDEKAVAGHAHTSTKRRDDRGGTGIGQGKEAGVHWNVDQRSCVRGAPDRSGDSALRKATQISLKRGERMVGNDIMV